MTDRILVTAATGTVGSTVVPALDDADVAVRAASRRPDRAVDAFDTPVEATEFSFARPETWGQTLAGVDRVFLVMPPGIGVGPVCEFVDAAGRMGVSHLAYLSILGAERLPVLPHRRIERHLDSLDLDTTFLRAAYFAQNLADIHRPEIVERDEIFVPAGDGAMGFVDARDVGAVAARVLTESSHRNRAYDITGPESLDFHAVASIATDVLDRRIRYADPSVVTFARRMHRRGVAPSLIAFMIAEYTVTRLGWASRTSDDVERVLDRHPRTVRDFFEDHRLRFSRE